MDKEKTFETIKDIMVSEFKFALDSINPENNLHDDLELDSLDMVDFILALNDQLGKKFEPSQFKEAKTVQGLIDIISKS